MEFQLDKDGKILDTNKLYDMLDEWHDNNEFNKIVLTITAIPREQWSVRLALKLISAYNNLKQFDEALKELDEIEPKCKTPAEKAKFYYMHGYIYYANDQEMMAISCYNKGIAEDPENTSKLDLEEEVEDCRKYIDNALKELEKLSENIYNDITEICSEKPEDEKDEVDEEEFTLYLGLLPALRRVPGMEHGMGFDTYFKKYKGEDREKVLHFLAEFGITDKESMLEFYQNDISCNLMGLYQDVFSYIEGKPNFDIEELDDDGKEAFLNAVEFCKPFCKYLPPAGVWAWDLSEKIGFVRLAYSCDLLKNSDYCSAMIAIYDYAKESFSSFKEYLLSLAFGYGVYEFHCNSWSISETIKHMSRMMPFMLKSALPYIKWKK